MAPKKEELKPQSGDHLEELAAYDRRYDPVAEAFDLEIARRHEAMTQREKKANHKKDKV